MTTFATGRQAEAIAAAYLEKQGYQIIEQNYRTRWCEIDIVAQKDGTTYFVEVKYRQDDEQGGGLDYITPKKLQRMAFAANFWCADRNYDGPYCLAAVELTGDNFEITAFIDSLT